MEQYLVHHGIKGQKWGIRRYQNEDGTLTEEGKKRTLRYRVGEKRLNNRVAYTAKVNDKFAARAGISENMKSINTEHLRTQTENILKDPDRVMKIGKGTITRRVAAISAASISAGAGVVAGMATGTLPLAVALSAVPVGLSAYYYWLTEK